MGPLVRILLSWVALFALAACSMGITGCSKDSNRSNHDLVKYNLRIVINQSAVNDTELIEIASNINEGEAVSHKLITEKYEALVKDSTDQDIDLKLLEERQNKTGKEYEAEEHVVIHTPDGNKVGQMQLENDRWALKADVTTQDIKIMNASFYVLIQIYKDYLLSPTFTKLTAFDHTKQKYDLVTEGL